MNDIILVLERFLNNELDATLRAEVQQKLESDPAFKQEYNRLIEIRDAAKRASQRNLVQKVGKQFHFKKTIQIAAATVIAIGAIAASIWAISSISKTKQEANKPSESNLSPLAMQFDDQKSMKHVPSQYFELLTSDTVVFSENGVLVSIPHDAFLRDGLPYNDAKTIQYQEAMDAGTIIKGGLSTMAGDRLLETQGMFGVKAFDKNGKMLEMNPKVGVYLQVPVDEHKKGMQVFKGKPDKDGNLDWVDPTPLEKLPVSANMTDLDLFPEKYEPELDRIKWKTSKKSRDSLYLSFDESEGLAVDELETTGKSLFENNCATCHQVKKDGTGPKLYQVREKWAKAGNKPSAVVDWVKNWSKEYKINNYARSIANWAPTAMNNFPNLSTSEINSIFDYIDGKDAIIVPPRKLTIEEFKFLYPGKGVLIDNNMTEEEAQRLKIAKQTNDVHLRDTEKNKNFDYVRIYQPLRTMSPLEWEYLYGRKKFENRDMNSTEAKNLRYYQKEYSQWIPISKKAFKKDLSDGFGVSFIHTVKASASFSLPQTTKYAIVNKFMEHFVVEDFASEINTFQFQHRFDSMHIPWTKRKTNQELEIFIDAAKIKYFSVNDNTSFYFDNVLNHYGAFHNSNQQVKLIFTITVKLNNISFHNGNITVILDQGRINKKNRSKYIPPSKVLAIWDNKFNNTNLATRDFEKRMKEIHKTNDPKVLAAYTSNLDKSLYEVDLMVVKLGYPAFNTFANEHVGKVTASNPHLKNLNDFYKKAIAQLVAEKNKTQEKERTQERAFDDKIAKSKKRNTTESIARDAENLQEEYKLNHEVVSRQLGYTVGLVLQNTIIVNIDKYVMEATIARKTTTIVDPFTGKTAQIIYNDFSLEIEEYKKYDRVFLYLFPNKMNSFQRIDPINGKIVYNLNNLFTYDMALVGFNKSGMYWKSLTDVKKGSKGKQTLTQISSADFEAKMASLNKNRRGAEASVANELVFLKNEQENYKVQALRQEMVLFRQKIRGLIFGESNSDRVEDSREPQ